MSTSPPGGKNLALVIRYLASYGSLFEPYRTTWTLQFLARLRQQAALLY